MKKEILGTALLCLCLLAAGTSAYITPKDSFDMHYFYDIYRVNMINGTTANFTYIYTAAGDVITNFTDTFVDVTGDSMTGDLTVDDTVNASTITGSTEVKAGVDDTSHGEVLLYGGDTGTDDGGCAKWYTSDKNDDSIEYYAWNIDEDDFILKQGSTSKLTLSGADGNLIFASSKLTHSGGTFDFDDDAVTTTGTVTGGDFECSDCIASDDIADVDDADVEGDLNTYVDIAGDIMTGALEVLAAISSIDWSNVTITASQITDTDAGTDITTDLEEEVTEGSLADSVIVSADIKDDTIDSDDYAAGSIDAEHLAADIIDETKLADNSTDSEHYNYDSIDDVHINWGSGASQVDSDDVPEGSTNYYDDDGTDDDVPEVGDFDAFAGGDHCTYDTDANALDIDDDFVLTAGDTMAGNLTLDTAGQLLLDGDNLAVWFGADQDVVMYFDGTDFIIKVA